MPGSFLLAQPAGEHLQFIGIHAVVQPPLPHRAAAVCKIHPHDGFQLFLLKPERRGLNRLPINVNSADLMIFKEPSSKNRFPVCPVKPYKLQVLSPGVEPQLLLQLPECGGQKIVSRLEMPRRRDIVTARVGILVPAPLL